MIFLFFLSIRKMNEKTLKFENIRVNKKEFHKSKQPVDLASVNIDQIVISGKFKHSDEGFKYFIGYKEGEIVKPLCIILPQMNGYIKYFENGGKHMLFFSKDDDVLYKYKTKFGTRLKKNETLYFIASLFMIKKYIKAKVRRFAGVIKTNFLGKKVPKENIRYTCIACLTVDSVVRMDKKIIGRFI